MQPNFLQRKKMQQKKIQQKKDATEKMQPKRCNRKRHNRQRCNGQRCNQKRCKSKGCNKKDAAAKDASDAEQAFVACHLDQDCIASYPEQDFVRNRFRLSHLKRQDVQIVKRLTSSTGNELSVFRKSSFALALISGQCRPLYISFERWKSLMWSGISLNSTKRQSISSFSFSKAISHGLNVLPSQTAAGSTLTTV